MGKVNFFVVSQSILFIVMNTNLQNFKFSFAGKSNTILITFSMNKKSFKFQIAKMESRIDGWQQFLHYNFAFFLLMHHFKKFDGEKMYLFQGSYN